ncbi:Nucleoside-diphosphate kinase [Pyrolobus fumarii 1A]|uniref:Nucleoside diphosphate kinase n=1 Tax=Pyrolobus fumarii (strain DSM 11204 / 1A) TaxID=694429 RepID=G0EEA2_PYRF1|nr:nucleoside-diphosphate kinase [Pyrolobus fumarii]AEM38796.1 Nucleoside-diphosphate kinase [Pyrolobus fumarii 1A]
MAVQRTFVMIKPDGVKRGLIGEIIARFERKGLKIKALKMKKLTREEAEKLYDIHKGKPFFEELINFVTSAPVVGMVLEGDEAVSVVRLMIGPTDGRKAPPGTIRGDFALSIGENVIHASDSPERAEYEIKVFFKDDEIIDW